MNRDQAEHVLTPIWLGFAAAEARLEDLLEQFRTGTMTEVIALGGLRHEAELEEALAYLKARSRAFVGDGLMTAVDTGRKVFIWPNVLPSLEAPAIAIARWKESRTAAPVNVAPLRREA